ncbi:FG-GAP-like repeat-containing protein, partial [bacterium]|nr:FG-GAP-like repeat-containing protein [bacterium]
MSKPVSRNAPCSCGSKRKYKHCCGKAGAQRRRKDRAPTASTPSTESNNSVSESELDSTASTSSQSKKFGLRLIVACLLLLGCFAFLAYQVKTTYFASNGNASVAAFTKSDAEQSHDTMLRVLQVVASGASEHHPYLGTNKLTQIRRALAATDSSNKDLLCTLHFKAGLKEGNLGNLRESIAEYETAQDLISQTNFDETKANYVKFKLGVAYLRLGETENCCITGGPESCIVPIGPAGVHQKKEGSQKAIENFLKILESNADSTFASVDQFANSTSQLDVNRAARWLLNVAHMTLGTYPSGVPKEYLVPESVFRSTLSFPKFKNISQGLGLNTFDLCGGVICDDFDNDGNLDIVTSSWGPKGQLNFFRNKGDGSFENLTKPAGLTGIFGGLNINQTDFNNDGHLDIFIMRGAWLQAAGRMPNSLLRNNGDGTFTDISYIAGLAGEGLDFPTQTSQWGDYDADGDLDLFVGNEHNEKITAPCQLFRNNGDETFTNVAKLAGVENRRITKGAAFGDYDSDGDLDLFLSNLRGPNRLYRNDGDGTFVDVAVQSGVTKPIASFPAWFFDFNNDGNLDLFVTSYTGTVDSLVDYYCENEARFEPSRLYQGDGKGKFTDVSAEQNLNVPMLAMGSNFGDLNNDGFLDFYLGTGSPAYEALTPNLMFLNQGGSGFADITMAAGFGHL